MQALHTQFLSVNGIRLCVHVAGPETGRPVWLLHGFPECWHSWREQIPALTAAGYRVFVPEMRGYGASDAPADIEAYDVLTICADIQVSMTALDQHDVCMIGHDWGAMIAWHLAQLEPERISAVVTLSVPFAGRGKRPAIEIMREVFSDRFNYIVYFQQPGVAEQELDADIARSLRIFMQGASSSDLLLQPRSKDSTLFAGIETPAQLPEWCAPEDFAVYVETFADKGFRGAINWYRNFERNWQRTDFLQDVVIHQPTLFMVGEQDPVATLEAYTISKMPSRVSNLEQHQLTDCGHWIQSEKAAEVNARLLAFLGQHYPAEKVSEAPAQPPK
ncbi:alpha/beta fold hydrolase [Pseudomonas marincola]|uniref:alpha/beta fold hydrolase n=1 Tax=Pseudomonas marincola TaxID=437900 RepID=UPI0008E8E43D|nr:alpha/beta hydrolase [Pseudomonas marincola]SFU06754.1 Pimeloyl-ACP methyl ester carboxylesterase [Pseudomonas marincola]